MAEQVYSLVHRWFHWIIAVLIIFMLGLGLIMGEVPKGPLAGMFYSTHKLVGFVLIFLVIARILNRLFRPLPQPVEAMPLWQKRVSGLVHFGLYSLILAVPVLGWLGVSAYGSLKLYNSFSLPALISLDKPFAEKIFDLHNLSAYLLGVLVIVHIGAAFYHRYVVKDGVFSRMWPGMAKKS